MSTPVNFSSLTSLSTISNTDQLLVRLDNSLSGTSGFGRITKARLLSSVDLTSLSANWQNTYTTVSTNSGSWATPSVFSGTLSAATYVANIASLNVTSYILLSGDASRTIIDTAPTTTTYSVPPNSVTPFSVGTQIIVIQGNKNASNYTTISAGVGVTINSYTSSLSLGGNYAAGTLIKTNTNTWYLIGNLA